MGFNVMCPKCHRLFSVKKKEKEFVMETFVRTEEVEKEPLPGAYRTGAGGSIIPSVLIVKDQHRVTGEISVYKLHLECKHCGHQWTEAVDQAKF